MTRLLIASMLVAALGIAGCGDKTGPDGKPATTRTPPPDPNSPGVQAGKIVFQDNCQQCHQADGSGTTQARTNLRGVFGRLDEGKIRDTIVHGRNFMPGVPDLSKPERKADMDHLMEYLRWLTAPKT
ncbi:MAG: hypothetical protein BIFFINMI_02960 [Phycisphaerae bacterium]|nr:hypothetical protein [Phycisphaerae bacterium]